MFVKNSAAESFIRCCLIRILETGLWDSKIAFANREYLILVQPRASCGGCGFRGSSICYC